MTRRIDWIVQRFDAVDSTMDEAARLAAMGAPEGIVVRAEFQRAGRGRAGRAWASPPGASLLITLLLRPEAPPDRLSVLPLIAGIAVAEAIEALDAGPVWLKWPNDVWLGNPIDGRKAAGILTSGRTRGDAVEYALVGIGINVSSPADSLPPGATSLEAASGSPIDCERLLAALLAAFANGYAEFLAHRGRPPLDGWRRRAALLDQDVAVMIGGEWRAGTLLGIDDDGALLLRAGGKTVRIVAGDLVRGPRPADQAAQRHSSS
jgi:BirA family transcriptional regulator, biotin operon repressor / biotin---[acetyl-CoA-carboxylase] ligase